MRPVSSIALQAAALAASALLCAWISNTAASPSRHLTWLGSPPIPVAAPAPRPHPAIPSPQPEPTRPSLLVSPKQTSPKSQAVPSFPPRPGQPIREISPQEAGEAFSAGATFLDARRSAEYELGHVRGAWSLPIWEDTLETRLIEFEAKAIPSPEAALVLYCSGGSCEDSHLLAAKLFQMGYRNLLIYRDGYPDWVAQGRPIAKGPVR